MKLCSGCGVTKPLSEFYPKRERRPRKTARRQADRITMGVMPRCKPCHKATRTRGTEYRREERERTAARAGRRYTPRSELTALRSAARAEADARRTERLLQLEAWRVAKATPEGREQQRERRREWSRRQHLRRVACVARGAGTRTARFQLYAERSDGTLTLAVVERLYAEPFCAYCARELDDSNRTLDHVVPLHRGGTHGLSNVVPACALCNDAKGRKLLSEWIGPPLMFGRPSMLQCMTNAHDTRHRATLGSSSDFAACG